MMIKNWHDLISFLFKQRSKSQARNQKSRLLIYDIYLKKYVSSDELLIPSPARGIEGINSWKNSKDYMLFELLLKKFINPKLDLLSPPAVNPKSKIWLCNAVQGCRYASTVKERWDKRPIKGREESSDDDPASPSTSKEEEDTSVGWAGQVLHKPVSSPRPEHCTTDEASVIADNIKKSAKGISVPVKEKIKKYDKNLARTGALLYEGKSERKKRPSLVKSLKLHKDGTLQRRSKIKLMTNKSNSKNNIFEKSLNVMGKTDPESAEHKCKKEEFIGLNTSSKREKETLFKKFYSQMFPKKSGVNGEGENVNTQPNMDQKGSPSIDEKIPPQVNKSLDQTSTVENNTLAYEPEENIKNHLLMLKEKYNFGNVKLDKRNLSEENEAENVTVLGKLENKVAKNITDSNKLEEKVENNVIDHINSEENMAKKAIDLSKSISHGLLASTEKQPLVKNQISDSKLLRNIKDRSKFTYNRESKRKTSIFKNNKTESKLKNKMKGPVHVQKDPPSSEGENSNLKYNKEEKSIVKHKYSENQMEKSVKEHIKVVDDVQITKGESTATIQNNCSDKKLLTSTVEDNHVTQNQEIHMLEKESSFLENSEKKFEKCTSNENDNQEPISCGNENDDSNNFENKSNEKANVTEIGGQILTSSETKEISNKNVDFLNNCSQQKENKVTDIIQDSVEHPNNELLPQKLNMENADNLIVLKNDSIEKDMNIPDLANKNQLAIDSKVESNNNVILNSNKVHCTGIVKVDKVADSSRGVENISEGNHLHNHHVNITGRKNQTAQIKHEMAKNLECNQLINKHEKYLNKKMSQTLSEMGERKIEKRGVSDHYQVTRMEKMYSIKPNQAIKKEISMSEGEKEKLVNSVSDQNIRKRKTLMKRNYLSRANISRRSESKTEKELGPFSDVKTEPRSMSLSEVTEAATKSGSLPNVNLPERNGTIKVKQSNLVNVLNTEKKDESSIKKTETKTVSSVNFNILPIGTPDLSKNKRVKNFKSDTDLFVRVQKNSLTKYNKVKGETLPNINTSEIRNRGQLKQVSSVPNHNTQKNGEFSDKRTSIFITKETLPNFKISRKNSFPTNEGKSKNQAASAGTFNQTVSSSSISFNKQRNPQNLSCQSSDVKINTAKEKRVYLVSNEKFANTTQGDKDKVTMKYHGIEPKLTERLHAISAQGKELEDLDLEGEMLDKYNVASYKGFKIANTNSDTLLTKDIERIKSEIKKYSVKISNPSKNQERSLDKMNVSRKLTEIKQNTLHDPKVHEIKKTLPSNDILDGLQKKHKQTKNTAKALQKPTTVNISTVLKAKSLQEIKHEITNNYIKSKNKVVLLDENNKDINKSEKLEQQKFNKKTEMQVFKNKGKILPKPSAAGKFPEFKDDSLQDIKHKITKNKVTLQKSKEVLLNEIDKDINKSEKLDHQQINNKQEIQVLKNTVKMLPKPTMVYKSTEIKDSLPEINRKITNIKETPQNKKILLDDSVNDNSINDTKFEATNNKETLQNKKELSNEITKDVDKTEKKLEQQKINRKQEIQVSTNTRKFLPKPSTLYKSYKIQDYSSPQETKREITNIKETLQNKKVLLDEINKDVNKYEKLEQQNVNNKQEIQVSMNTEKFLPKPNSSYRSSTIKDNSLQGIKREITNKTTTLQQNKEVLNETNIDTSKSEKVEQQNFNKKQEVASDNKNKGNILKKNVGEEPQEKTEINFLENEIKISTLQTNKGDENLKEPPISSRYLKRKNYLRDKKVDYILKHKYSKRKPTKLFKTFNPVLKSRKNTKNMKQKNKLEGIKYGSNEKRQESVSLKPKNKEKVNRKIKEITESPELAFKKQHRSKSLAIFPKLKLDAEQQEDTQHIRKSKSEDILLCLSKVNLKKHKKRSKSKFSSVALNSSSKKTISKSVETVNSHSQKILNNKNVNVKKSSTSFTNFNHDQKLEAPRSKKRLDSIKGRKMSKGLRQESQTEDPNNSKEVVKNKSSPELLNIDHKKHIKKKITYGSKRFKLQKQNDKSRESCHKTAKNESKPKSSLLSIKYSDELKTEKDVQRNHLTKEKVSPKALNSNKMLDLNGNYSLKASGKEPLGKGKTREIIKSSKTKEINNSKLSDERNKEGLSSNVKEVLYTSKVTPDLYPPKPIFQNLNKVKLNNPLPLQKLNKTKAYGKNNNLINSNSNIAGGKEAFKIQSKTRQGGNQEKNEIDYVNLDLAGKQLKFENKNSEIKNKEISGTAPGSRVLPFLKSTGRNSNDKDFNTLKHKQRMENNISDDAKTLKNPTASRFQQNKKNDDKEGLKSNKTLIKDSKRPTTAPDVRNIEANSSSVIKSKLRYVSQSPKLNEHKNKTSKRDHLSCFQNENKHNVRASTPKGGIVKTEFKGTNTAILNEEAEKSKPFDIPSDIKRKLSSFTKNVLSAKVAIKESILDTTNKFNEVMERQKNPYQEDKIEEGSLADCFNTNPQTTITKHDKINFIQSADFKSDTSRQVCNSNKPVGKEYKLGPKEDLSKIVKSHLRTKSVTYIKPTNNDKYKEERIKTESINLVKPDEVDKSHMMNKELTYIKSSDDKKNRKEEIKTKCTNFTSNDKNENCYAQLTVSKKPREDSRLKRLSKNFRLYRTEEFDFDDKDLNKTLRTPTGTTTIEKEALKRVRSFRHKQANKSVPSEEMDKTLIKQDKPNLKATDIIKPMVRKKTIIKPSGTDPTI